MKRLNSQDCGFFYPDRFWGIDGIHKKSEKYLQEAVPFTPKWSDLSPELEDQDEYILNPFFIN